MIGILPKIYPNELFYSFLSRYSVMVAGNTYRGVSEDLYTNSLCSSNILLLNHMTEDFLSKLKSQASLLDIVLNHTLFPWFCRFAKKERRDAAFKLAIEMNVKKLYDSLPIPNYADRYGEERMLKYCPECVRNDRRIFGETYFRTYHQIFELNICPQHKCELQKSKIIVDGRVSPSLAPAENVIPTDSKINHCKSELEVGVAEYLLKVFQEPFDADSKGEIGEYLDYRLRETPYIKRNGMRNMEMITTEFNSFYSPIGIRREYWQLQKVFSNYVYNAYEVSLMGIFLRISPKELCEHRVQ